MKTNLNGIFAASSLFLLACSPAMAGDGWSYTLETEFERVEADGGNDFNAASIAGILGYRSGMNKFDFKLEITKSFK
jgi:hypothetical protein